jgi:hypothetical protein
VGVADFRRASASALSTRLNYRSAVPLAELVPRMILSVPEHSPLAGLSLDGALVRLTDWGCAAGEDHGSSLGGRRKTLFAKQVPMMYWC